MSTLRTLVASSRPLSWVNTAYPFGAAYLLAGGGIDLRFVLGCLFFLIPYNLAMYGINDVFDYESDLRNPRKGGVEGAVLARGTHRTVLWASALTTVPFLVFFLVTGSLVSAAVLGLSMFALVAYSARGLRFKEIPVLDSLTSSTHFSSPAWFALAWLGTAPSRDGLLALAAFFLWGAASQAFGAVQDVVPDREGGIASIATALGARTTVIVSLLAYATAGGLMAAASAPAAWAAVLAVPYIASVARFLRIDDATSAEAHRGWTTFLWLNYVVGFLVTLLLLFGI